MPENLAKRKALENTVKRIQGVVACKVVLDSGGEIEEIHVLTSSHRDAGQVARDVESAIMAVSGIKIDRRKVSVAQTHPDNDARDKARPVLVRVAFSAGKSEAKATVELSLGSTMVSGKAEGISTPNRWLWIAAEATIDALQRLLPAKVRLVLNEVGTTQSKLIRVAVVTLILFDGGQELVLSGSCPISYDERESVVRATLDAINRRFGMLLDN